ncbi:MAG TPA: LemA family protein, partial [Burkholderiales bacterium]|nr:LemA family protein [Burkholderiales bacterium]
MGRRIAVLIALVTTLLVSGCGYNTLQSTDEQTKAAWSEVLNQYQRRADLVPNLVETVKAFAKQEQDVFTQVTEARSRVGSIQATPELVENPEAFRRFQQAQGELTSALSPPRPRSTSARSSRRDPGDSGLPGRPVGVGPGR